MFIVLYVKCPLFLSDFNESLDLFPKNIQISNFMKIKPVEVELLHVDGRKWRS